MSARRLRRVGPVPSIPDALAEPLLQDRISACRRARGLTQEQVAKQVGMNGHAWLANIEKGRARPVLDGFFELARVLDVDPVALYQGWKP